MANTRLTAILEVKNAPAVTKFLRGFKQRSEEIEKNDLDYVRLLSAIVFKDVIDHFEEEQGPGQRRWKGWSKSYRRMLEKQNRLPKKILQTTGHLKQSFKPTSFRRMKNGILWYNNAKTNKGFPYAAAHDTGGPKLPRRRFMYLSKKASDEIAKQSLKYMEKPI